MKIFMRTIVGDPAAWYSRFRSGLWSANAVVRLLAIVLITLCASAVAKPAPGNLSGVTNDTDETPANVLNRALQRWTKDHFVGLDDPEHAFTFALQDQRLSIPECTRFQIDSSGQSARQRAPKSIVVEVSCPGIEWQRKVRGRLQGPPRQERQTTSKPPPIAVFQPVAPINKGDVVDNQALRKVWVPPQRAPQNAITKLDNVKRYAGRDLRAGQTLVASDLVTRQPVVILTQAIPAGTRITSDMITVSLQAVDVPRDAVRSLEGLELLAASRLLHPGDILRRRDLRKARLVKRGQRVSVESTGAYFRIASELVALEDGFLGDQIELRNPNSDRQINAVIVGPAQARSL